MGTAGAPGEASKAALVPSILRFYPEARSAHVERARTLAAAETIYLRPRADFDRSLGQTEYGFEQLTLLRLAVRVWRGNWSAVELPEPLWLRYVPHTAFLMAVIRVRDSVTRRRTRLVSYAIENAKADQRPRALTGLPNWAWRLGLRAVVALQLAMLDRLAFGTEGAQAVVAAAAGKQLNRVEHALIEALPAPCACLTDHHQSRDSSLVVFVGHLEQRKGVDWLIRAWPEATRQCSGAKLIVAGGGALHEKLKMAAESDPSISVVGPLGREAVHDLLRRAGVLVLPSVPFEGWREQVGLPITEGLAHGCRIVTTSETGLATWLETHGHAVIAPTGSSAELATAITNMIDAFNPTQVTSELPSVDGRIAADRWLLRAD